MPAVSKSQAIAMNLAQAVQKGKATAKPGSPSAEIAGSMRPSDVADFATTPQKGLPKKAKPTKPPVMKKKPGMKVKNVGKPVKKMKFM